MNILGIVLSALIGGAAGGLYSLIRIRINKAKTKKFSDSQEAPPVQKRSNPLPFILAVLLPIILFNAIFSGIQSKPTEKTFTKEGFSITLTSNFTEKDVVSQTAYYQSSSSYVFALKEEFSLFESVGINAADYTLDDYAKLVMENNSVAAALDKKDGLTSFIYEKHVNGKDITYLATVHKGADAFWLIQFACETKDFGNFQNQFIKWAKTVKV